MSPEEQFGQILTLLGENSKGITELKQSMSELKTAKESFNSWKPKVDHRVADLEHVVNNLGERMEQLFHQSINSAKSPSPGASEVVDPHLDSQKTGKSEKLVLGSAHLEPSLLRATSGPRGHREEHPHRSTGFGVVYTTLTPPPVTGTENLMKPISTSNGSSDSAGRDRCIASLINSAMPNMSFPQFDGSNPRLWIKNCETYFEVYEVDFYLWVRLATMNLTGSAALWLQTVHSTVYNLPWADFAVAICARFGRDEYNHLLRQFFHIRQPTNVHEYIETFSYLIHQLLAHDPKLVVTVITNRFIDGLKKDIKSVVMVHRPQDLDSASSLALL